MIEKWIDDNSKEYIELSDKIWDFSELKFNEHKSSQVIINIMREKGFNIEEKAGGIDTAFVCTYGEGHPVIGFLGEYDALDGLSQQADVDSVYPQEGTSSGHGCGHQLLGTASALAAASVKEYMIANNVKGTVKYYGCPGEEGGGGKGFMAREGLFDDLDTAITWHPSFINSVSTGSSLANLQSYFVFNGRSSHAGGAPHLGRSALDAVELMNVGCNFLREHIIPEARIHYAITNSGGISPNVVQGKAEVLYLVRAPEMEELKGIYERVCDVARGAALMTGTSVEIDFVKGTSNIIPNDVLCTIVSNIALEMEGNTYNNEEQEYAKKFIDTLTKEEKNRPLEKLNKKHIDKKLMKCLSQDMTNNPVFTSFIPFINNDGGSSGSTDVGDVSYVTPTVECLTACYAIGTPGHSWQLVAQGKSSIAHKGLVYAAKIMAKTGEYLFENPEYIIKAKEEFRERLDGKKYECPIPKEVKPRRYK